MRKATAAEFQIVAAAILFSTGGAAIKAAALSSWQIAGLRSGLAAVMLLLLLPAARRWSWKAALVALAYAATMILFVAANKMTTSLNSIFLQDTAPLYILVLSPWLLKESIRLRDVLIMGIIGAGLLLFFVEAEPAQTTSPAPLTGNILAALSGLSWAMVIMGLRWLGRTAQQQQGLAAVAIGNLMTLLICLPLLLPMENASTTDWLIVAYLGIAQVGLAYLFLTRGLAAMPAFAASILLLIEPVLNPIWSFLIHGESPGRWAIAGSGLILAGTLTKIMLDSRGYKSPATEKP